MFDQPLDRFEPLDLSVAADDRTAAAPPGAVDRPDGFQLPSSIWLCLLACYAFFIAALAVAAGGSGPARLVLAISAFFMIAYFGTAAMLARLGPQDRVEASAAKPLQTIYGPLPMGAVRAQILTVPIAIASFGLAILVIAGVVME
jgi:hypothetical protein